MPIRENTVVVKGYTELIQAFARADAQVNSGMRKVLKDVGEIVRADAAARFSNYDARSAAGYRTVVSQKGVDVRQSIRATTHDHPEYGALQMRKAFLPALDAKRGQVEGAFESFLDRVTTQNF